MDTTIAINLATVALTGCGAMISVWSSRSAKRANELTERIHKDQSQPYVSVDLRGDKYQPTMAVLVLRNTGPTVASDAEVSFHPLLALDPQMPGPRQLDVWNVSSLAPGAEIVLPLGFGGRFFEVNQTKVQVTISARGLEGEPIPELVYQLDVPQIARGAAGQKTINDVARAAGDIADHLRDIAKKLDEK